MTIKQLINRAYMQAGDTSQITYTPYQFLEFYNEGNQLIHDLVGRYIPGMLAQSLTETVALSDGITLPDNAVSIVSVKVDGTETEEFTLLGMTKIAFVAGDTKTHDVIVTYIPTTGYKVLDDESGYPSEIESMLVAYMVARVMNADLSFMQMWETSIARLSQSGEQSFIREGYYYDSTRLDYEY